MRNDPRLAAAAVVCVLLSCATHDKPAQIDCTKDEQCPGGQLCNRLTNVCYPTAPRADGGGGGDALGEAGAADQGPPLRNAARGTFTCPLFAATPPPDAEGTMDVHLELEGTRYWASLACACYTTTSYFVCQLNAYDAAVAKEAVVSLSMRKDALAAAAFAVPEQIYGNVGIGAPKGPWQPAAMVWGGIVTFTRTGPDEITGALDVSLEPIRPKPFGGVCRLKQSCAAGCALLADERYSPDCDATADCVPLFDGTARGVCTAFCQGDADCQKLHADTKCLGATQKLCFKTCADSSQCELPLKCSTPDYVCKVQ